MMGAQLQTVAPPALVVVDGETSITVLAQRLWPATPIQRCWWHLPHGLRKAFYADDAADRHVNPRWARTTCDRLAELLREQIRAEHTTAQALTAWDEFTATIPAGLTSAHAYLAAARPHAFTGLDPKVRTALARLGGPNWEPASWNGSCARSTPAPTSAASAGPRRPTRHPHRHLRPHPASCTTPPGLVFRSFGAALCESVRDLSGAGVEDEGAVDAFFGGAGAGPARRPLNRACRISGDSS